VASASTYKVLVLLELACQVAEGRVSPTGRLRVPPGERTLGPTGLSVLQDDVELSVRDLALLMMQISDNTATDVVQRLVGTEAIGRRLEGLGLHRTVVESDCAGLLAMLRDELGGDVDALDPAELVAALAASPSLNAVRGNRTTPREMTRLLDLVWTDRWPARGLRGGPPGDGAAACAAPTGDRLPRRPALGLGRRSGHQRQDRHPLRRAAQRGRRRRLRRCGALRGRRVRAGHQPGHAQRRRRPGHR
jgi:hypothetical protein